MQVGDPGFLEVLEVLHVVDVAVDVDVGEPDLHRIVVAVIALGLTRLLAGHAGGRLEEALETLALVGSDPARLLGGEDVRREQGRRPQVDDPAVGSVVVDLVGHREAGGADLGDPRLDLDRLGPELQRGGVLHLVPYDDHALGQVVGATVRGMSQQHVDPRLLEVVDVDHVVDVALLVEVGPSQWAFIDVTHPAMVSEDQWLSETCP